MSTLTSKKLSMNSFMEIRENVLTQWPTGAEVRDLDEAIKYQQQIPQHKSFANKLLEAKSQGKTLTQPRAGVALPNEHIDLLRYLETKGGADLLPTTIDSYTRLNRYKEAEQGIRESMLNGRSLLNGFPAVNHGTAICRTVTESVGVPIQVRHGTPDARLLAEITLAGGFTSFEGGGISYNIPYSKNVPLEDTLRNWQYCDRLVGIYQTNGITINREPFGPLTGTLVPPCISHAVAVIEAVLAAEQGVRNITVGYGQCGNLIQDVAAIRSLEMITNEYLYKFGFEDTVITTVMHQWMGGFPSDEAKAFGVISWGAATASIAGATKVIVKTPHEAMGIPTKDANAQGIKCTKQVLTMLSDQFLPMLIVRSEINQILEETRAILDKVIELGKGDFVQGTILAFRSGVLDIPFSPSNNNIGLAMPARDNDGCIRFYEFGNLPFDNEIKEFHRAKMNKRAQAESREVCFQMVIDDINAVSKGSLVGRKKQ